MKAVRRALRAFGIALATALLSLVYVAALLLQPFRIGRLLRTVSIPRFHEHRLRTSLTVIGIGLGVAVLIGVVLISRSILGSFESTVEDISGKVDLQITASADGFDEELLYDVKDVPGVWKATPVIQETAVIRDEVAHGDRLLILGVDFLGEDDDYFREYDSDEMQEIREEPFRFLNSPTNIILARKVADRLGLGLRDTITLATPEGKKAFTVWGFIEDEGVGRAFGGAVAVMYYQAMQVSFGRGSNIDRIDIAVAKDKTPAEVTAALREALGEGLDIDPPERSSERASRMLNGLNTGLMMGSLIALLVGMFLIYNTMSISVVQRKREIGILRALGTTRRQILALFTLEGLLLGLVGSAMGVGLGILLAKVLLASMSDAVNELYLRVAATDVHTDPLLLTAGFVVGIGCAVVAALIPARAATRVRPVETLRSGNVVSTGRRLPMFTAVDALALLMLAATAPLLRIEPIGELPVGALAGVMTVTVGSALLVRRAIQGLRRLLAPVVTGVFGIEGRMAGDNLERDLGRAAVTTAALMIGVSMATSFGAFLGSFKRSAFEWIDQSVPADLFITSASRFAGGGNVPMADLLYDDLHALPGVDLVERIRIADLSYQGEPYKVIASDIEIYFERSRMTYLEGSQEEAFPALQAGEILLSENFSRRLDLHAGDTIALETATGAERFHVAGVVIDYTSDRGVVVMDRALYARHWRDDRVDSYKLYLSKDADREAIRRTINERWGEKFDLFVLTNSEFKGEIKDLLDQTFRIMHALELVALVIALLGVINTLLASVLDRIREIGVLRAIGMLRRQVRKLLMVEAGLIGLISVATGVAVGLVTGYILLYYINLVQTGWYFPYRPPALPLLQMAALVVAVSVAAGYYPAREAAKLQVTDALEYE